MAPRNRTLFSIDMQRWCRSCKETKSLQEFPPNDAYTGGYSKICKDCARRKKWREQRKSAAKSRSVRLKMQLKKLGITTEDYDNLYAYQGGRCAICGRHESELPVLMTHPTRLVIDHDHATGCVRGLLCALCNVTLGGFRDSVALLRKAIAYLRTSEVRMAGARGQLALFAQDEQQEDSFPPMPLPPAPPELPVMTRPAVVWNGPSMDSREHATLEDYARAARTVRAVQAERKSLASEGSHGV